MAKDNIIQATGLLTTSRMYFPSEANPEYPLGMASQGKFITVIIKVTDKSQLPDLNKTPNISLN